MDKNKQDHKTKSHKNSILEIESIGIKSIPKHAQTAGPLDLLWVWCAANIGILAIIYGVIIMSFKLSFFQAILVIILGLSSFVLVGISSLAGFSGRCNTLTLSRRAFGQLGNKLPCFLSWFYLMGWEIINIVTGTLILVALANTLGFSTNLTLTLICFCLCPILIIITSLLGIKAVMFIQKYCAFIFGFFTLLIIGYILSTAQWASILAIPNGSWLTGFIPALSIIIAGTGLGWTIAGADYSRTQAPNTKRSHIMLAVIGGASLPLFLLMLAGVLLSLSAPDLATSNNPIAAIGAVLPNWMAIPYLITAVGAIIALGVLSLYSASLNVLSLGIKIKQRSAVVIDATIVLASSLYLLLLDQDLMLIFMRFLFFCGALISAWAAIFLIDFILKPDYQTEELFDISKKNEIKLSALIVWIISIVLGFLISKISFFGQEELGLLITFLISGILYYLVHKLKRT